MALTRRETIAAEPGGGRRSRRGARSQLLAATFFLLCSYLLISPFNIADSINPWLDGDYGMLTHNAIRILKGDMLYRDIWTVYGPAADNFVALIFRLLGDNLRSLRTVLALAGTATGLLVFYFGRSLTSGWIAAAVTALVFFLGPVTVNFPYPNWFCIPLGLGMVLFEHCGWKNKSVVPRLLAGAMAGLLFSFKPNWGVFALQALFCIQALGMLLNSGTESRFCLRGASAAWFLLALLLSAPALSLILIRDHFIPRNILFFTAPTVAIIAAGLAAYARKVRTDCTVIISLTPLILSSVGFGAIVVPLFGYYALEIGVFEFYRMLASSAKIFARAAYLLPGSYSWEALLLIGIICFQAILLLFRGAPRFLKTAVGLSAWAFGIFLVYRIILVLSRGVLAAPAGYGSYDKWAFQIVSYIPLSIHLGLAFVFIRDINHLDSVAGKRLHLLLSLWIYSVMTFHVLYPVSDIYHLIWVMPPVMALGSVFLFRSTQYWGVTSANEKASRWLSRIKLVPALVLPCVVGVFFGMPFFTYFFRLQLSPLRVSVREFADIESPRAGVLMPKHRAKAVSVVVNFVTGYSRPEEFIFDMTGSFFYFLADRRSPVRWGHFSFPDFLSEEDVATIIERLKELRPGIIVSSHEADRNFSASYPKLFQYIQTNYKFGANFEEYIVYFRVT